MIRSILFTGFITATLSCFSQPLISFKQIVSGLSNPVDIVQENNDSGRLFIVEKGGRIRMVKDSILLPRIFLDISSLISGGGEQGFLSMAFHPQYATTGFFFVYYTNTSGSVTIARYHRYNADSADYGSGVVLMTIPKPFTNHNGGKLNFGADGYLYFGTGDGGSGGDPYNNAQNDTSWLGKMLRINVNVSAAPYYSIPPDNPFAGSTAFKQEIIANGLRNPWRWSFDRQTNDMWIADVGQNLWEEVNTVPYADRLNKNYGWRCYEGTHFYNAGCPAQPNNVFPVFEYPHNDVTGGYSITGGFVYRGNEFPALQGYYLCADYTNFNGWLIKSNGNGTWTTTMQSNWPGSISSFGQKSDGTLYAVQLNSGKLYKIIASDVFPIKLLSFSGNVSSNKYELGWQVQNENKGDLYIIEKKSGNGELFTEISVTKALSDRHFNIYALKADLPQNETFFRLKIISVNGQISYSQIIRYSKNVKQTLKVFFTAGQVNILPPADTKAIELIDETGKKLWSRNGLLSSSVLLSLKQRGVFAVRAFASGEWQLVRFVY